MKYNLNPKHNNEKDCVIRAIGMALKQSWKITYMDLFINGIEQYRMADSDKVIDKYLRQKGWIKKTPQKRITVDELVREQKGSYVILIDNHLTYAENGVIFDIWDCSNEYVKKYWYKLTNE